jgi:hypothetical protein
MLPNGIWNMSMKKGQRAMLVQSVAEFALRQGQTAELDRWVRPAEL